MSNAVTIAGVETRKQKILLYYKVLLLAAVSGYLLYGLGSYGLLDNNEGLYAEIAREMAETRSLVIPLLNYVHYFEKPPLLYWLVSIVYALFGISEFTTRIVPVSASVAVIAGLVIFGRNIKRPCVGWMSALLLTSSFGYILISRTLIFDMLLTCLLSFSLIFFFFWYQEQRRGYIRMSYCALALAVLAKGLVAVLFFVLIAALFAALAREKKLSVHQLFDPFGLALLLVIAMPWHLLAMAKNHDFARFYFINEHIMRFLGTRVPKDYHTGPIYFYLLEAPVLIFPWAVFLPTLFYKEKWKLLLRSDLELFLWLWILVPLAVFSLSANKANYYMITVTPPLTFLLALRLEELISEERSALIGTQTALIALVGLLLSIVTCVKPDDSITFLHASGGFKSDYLFAFAIFTVGATVAALLMYSKRYFVAVGIIASLSLPLLAFSLHMVTRAEAYCTKKSFCDFLLKSEKDRAVFLYRDYEELSSLPFYLKGHVFIIDSASEDLSYGIKYSQDVGRFISWNKFQRFSRSHKVAVVVLAKRIDEFRGKSLARLFVEEKRAGNVVLYVN